MNRFKKRFILLLTIFLLLFATPAFAQNTFADSEKEVYKIERSVFNYKSKATIQAVPTEAEAYQRMIALKDQYPEGMRWTNDDYYESKSEGGKYIYAGYGCHAFALILSDAAFGNLPIEEHNDTSRIKVGDILRIYNNTHTVIVLEVHPDKLVIAEGNYNDSIHWGRELSRAGLVTDSIWTRYTEPQQDETDDSIVSSVRVENETADDFDIITTVSNPDKVGKVEYQLDYSKTPNMVYTANNTGGSTYSAKIVKKLNDDEVLSPGEHSVIVRIYDKASNVISEQSYSFSLTQNTKYTLQLNAEPSYAGQVSGAGSYEPGTTVDIHADANDGYSFVGWYTGDDFITNSESCQLTIETNMTLTARFEANEPEPDEPGQEIEIDNFKLTAMTLDSFSVQAEVTDSLEIESVSFEVQKDGESKEYPASEEDSIYTVTVPASDFSNPYGEYSVFVNVLDSSGEIYKSSASLTVDFEKPQNDTNDDQDSTDDPILPTDPNEPSEPSDSTDPTDPLEPSIPTEPGTPTDPSESIEPSPAPPSTPSTDNVAIYRLYNGSTGEHLYTSDQSEAQTLALNHGWTDEGTGWTAPQSGTPVYRLFNPSINDHLYTTDEYEVQVLTTQNGWQSDNGGQPLFYSGGSTPIYRLYNSSNGRHHLTKDENEYTVLPSLGWTQEGIKLNSIN